MYWPTTYYTVYCCCIVHTLLFRGENPTVELNPSTLVILSLDPAPPLLLPPGETHPPEAAGPAEAAGIHCGLGPPLCPDSSQSSILCSLLSSRSLSSSKTYLLFRVARSSDGCLPCTEAPCWVRSGALRRKARLGMRELHTVDPAKHTNPLIPKPRCCTYTSKLQALHARALMVNNVQLSKLVKPSLMSP